MEENIAELRHQCQHEPLKLFRLQNVHTRTTAHPLIESQKSLVFHSSLARTKLRTTPTNKPPVLSWAPFDCSISFSRGLLTVCHNEKEFPNTSLKILGCSGMFTTRHVWLPNTRIWNVRSGNWSKCITTEGSNSSETDWHPSRRGHLSTCCVSCKYFNDVTYVLNVFTCGLELLLRVTTFWAEIDISGYLWDLYDPTARQQPTPSVFHTEHGASSECLQTKSCQFCYASKISQNRNRKFCSLSFSKADQQVHVRVFVHGSVRTKPVKKESHSNTLPWCNCTINTNKSLQELFHRQNEHGLQHGVVCSGLIERLLSPWINNESISGLRVNRQVSIGGESSESGLEPLSRALS